MSAAQARCPASPTHVAGKRAPCPGGPVGRTKDPTTSQRCCGRRPPVAREPGGAMAARLLLLAVGLAAALVMAAALGWTPPASADTGGAASDGAVSLLFFYGAECQHCANERPFLVGLEARYPRLAIEYIEVWHDGGNRQRLREVAAQLGFHPAGTPVTVLGDQYWVGFDSAIARSIEAAVVAALGGREAQLAVRRTVDVPVFGAVDVADAPLVVSSLVIGFVDGVNPCSLWVLSVLLAIVLHSGSRGRVLAVGSVFLMVTTAMYGLYMTGMYSVLDYVGHLTWVRLAVAAVALVFGVIHMKDFFWFKEGPSLSIDDAQKPGLYRRMREVAAADKSLPAMLGGTVALAVGVSLLETPCTAGLPMLWTNLLATQAVPLATAAVLFAVYMSVFLLDELAVFAAAVLTLRATRVQEAHGRLLKLLSGTVMVTLALAMILMPALLESVSGTVQVFGLAVVLVAVIWSLARLAGRLRQGLA